MTIDWTSYWHTFPDRYLKLSEFDSVVSELGSLYVKEMKEITALDVGGGLGTQGLHQAGIKAYLADPYMSAPLWMQGNYRSVLDVENKFDLIVARGSFNYLEPAEISRIPLLLKGKGVFLFNTFSTPRSGERRYKNSASNIEGLERFVVEDKKVLHELIPDNGEPIRHSFFVYTTKEIEMMLAGCHVSFKRIGRNTLHGVATLS